MAKTTVRISRRTKNLGFGWSNSMGDGPSPRIVPPTSPSITGTAKECWAERERARQLNSGNDYSFRWFVGGKPVLRNARLSDDLFLLLHGDRDFVDVEVE